MFHKESILRSATSRCVIRSKPSVTLTILHCSFHTPLRQCRDFTSEASFKPIKPSTLRQSPSSFFRYKSGISYTSPSPDSPQTFTYSTPTSILDWNSFFRLRKKRRLYQQCSSIASGLGGISCGAQMITTIDFDVLVSQFSLDPFISLGLITAASGGLGWLLGPVAGTAIFNMINRNCRAQMDEKEKEFYKRVRKHRVDPSNSSMANPVPDFYGEKISSVHDYRQWLKDCRAFNKKRVTFL